MTPAQHQAQHQQGLEGQGQQGWGGRGGQQMVPTQVHAQMAQQQLQSLPRTSLLPKEDKIIRPTKLMIEQSGELIKKLVTESLLMCCFGAGRPFHLHNVLDHERQNYMENFQQLFKACQDMELKVAIWHAVFQDQESTLRLATLITMVKEQACLITSGTNQYVLSSQQVKSLLEDMEVAGWTAAPGADVTGVKRDREEETVPPLAVQPEVTTGKKPKREEWDGSIEEELGKQQQQRMDTYYDVQNFLTQAAEDFLASSTANASVEREVKSESEGLPSGQISRIESAEMSDSNDRLCTPVLPMYEISDNLMGASFGSDSGAGPSSSSKTADQTGPDRLSFYGFSQREHEEPIASSNSKLNPPDPVHSSSAAETPKGGHVIIDGK
ncbi:hypothetical protein M422DRAFT_265635 [Sphaerobolus stellatus SS14]|uniref:Uncharacterized protein n=1 Tax=Sphaerobolus stellatus (strain SS14) TaxID=990650 RepID=A0A0C9TQR1_SPHS4|nr:hypothetical protein M422DRAFT_265635 [Sphaerobolus stellatus SS14]